MIVPGIVAGGGGDVTPGYVAKGVGVPPGGSGLFGKIISADGLGVTDSAQMLFSSWVFVVTPRLTSGIDSPVPDGYNSLIGLLSGAGPNAIEYNLTSSTGAADPGIDFSSADGAFPDGEWFHLCGAVDMNFAAGSRVTQLYVNDALVALSTTQPGFDGFDNGSAFTIGAQDGPWVIGVNPIFGSGNPAAYFADLYCAFGQFLDLSVEANRRKFIDADGKPVDLGVDGSLPTGTVPTYFLHVGTGGAATDFLTNRAGNGDFTVNPKTHVGDLESGSATVVMEDGTSGFSVGWGVTGTGVPPGTTVLAIDDPTDGTVVMSASATATAAGQTLSFAPILTLAPTSPST